MSTLTSQIGRRLALRVVVLAELSCDLILGCDQMFNRSDGLDVTIGSPFNGGCVRFGDSGEWIAPSDAIGPTAAIAALRARIRRRSTR